MSTAFPLLFALLLLLPVACAAVCIWLVLQSARKTLSHLQATDALLAGVHARLASLTTAVETRLAAQDELHFGEWKALRHALLGHQVEHARLERERRFENETVPGPPAAPAATPARVPAAAIAPAPFPNGKTGSAPPPAAQHAPQPAPLARPASKPEPVAQRELTDDELDALPPDLPPLGKPRKRVMAPPKKPPLRSL